MRAMRMTFAASLALTGTGMAFAGTCTVPSPSSVDCTGVFNASIVYPNVPDLTLVLGAGGVPTSVVPAAGAIGVDVTSPGNIGITSYAGISTDGAAGIHTSGSDSAMVLNAGNIYSRNAMAIDASSAGDVSVVNTGAATVYGVYDVTAVRAETTGAGTVASIDNQATGSATATSNYGNAIGLYGYATAGDIKINNDGAVSATSTYGLADGIFASGVNVDVTNGATGSITASGFNWAAGIEAQSYDLSTVTNSGDISATATANVNADPYYGTAGVYGHAFGIYATGGAAGVNATNSGHITADGVYATGVLAQGGGPITVSNSGDITIGSSGALTTYYATGIQASNNYENSAIAVSNTGSIAGYGAFAATGIAATATGNGSAVSVSNAGGISVASAGSNYSKGTGIFASGDAGAYVHNAASGTIAASGNGFAYGVQALTFNGDAHVVNDGSVTASADGGAKYSAHAVGVLASSLNGNATVSNTGSISAHAYSQGGATTRGIYAAGVGADVVNSGTITTDGGSSLGIGAVGSTGDVTVLNQGSIHASGNKYSSGTGISGASTYGDVSLTNSSGGDIVALGVFGANGMQGRSFYGDANVVNAGTIEVGSSDLSKFSQPNAIGIYAASRTGNVSVVNSGTILAQTKSNPIGIEAFTTGDGTTTVDNSGVIQAIGQKVSVWGIYTGGKGGGDISVHNSGAIEASTGAFHATGIWGYAGTYDYYGNSSVTGDISVVNDGTITAFSGNPVGKPSFYGLKGSRASGIWVYGDHTDVANTGSIKADGFAWASGIEANGTDQVTVTNSGDISVIATADDATRRIYGQAFGIKATGGAGGVSVTNSGAITATAPFNAIGIYAAAVDGDISVSSAGAVSATSTYGVANGILASGVNVGVTGTGNITTNALGDAFGINGAATTGDISVSGGAVSATSTNGMANGIFATGANVSVTGTGNITATALGDVFGIHGVATAGNISVNSDGTISVTSSAGNANGILASGVNVGVTSTGSITASALNDAFGINGAATTGDISVNSAGVVSATSSAGKADGILASGVNVGVTSTGNITATALGDAFGIHGAATTGDISVSSAGTIAATSSAGNADGILASGTNVGVNSTGNITTTALGDAFGIDGSATAGDINVSSSGTVSATSSAGKANGLFASGTNVGVTSAGSLAATGYNWAAGIEALGSGAASVSNSGNISTSATSATGGQAFGVYASGGTGGATVKNTGTISASTTQAGDTAIGVLAQATGPVLVSNTGTISASQPNQAVAVSMASAAGSTLMNTGTITTVSALEGNIAVQGGAGDTTIQNFGDINGALVLGSGNDSFYNGKGGVWNVGNHATDFGAGDDTISNAAGGTINLADAAIRLGSSGSVGNAFNNAGTIKVTGNSLIDMGARDSAVPLAAAFTATAVPSLNAQPLTNNGVIDFRDGQPNDILTVNGDLAGNGQINLDVSLLNHTSDLLYVNGNIVNGASQKVNVSLDGGLPTTEHTPIQFAHVSGDATSSSFVKGQVTDLSPRNFLDMQVNVTSKIDPSNASADAFYVDLDVAGLNDFGTLAASIVPGATSLINSEVGTWRQRMGVVPLADGDKVSVAPWVRAFGDSGSVDPRHTADNFGQGGNFGYDQSNSGQELGLNLNLQSGVSVGALLGQSEGHQNLNGQGTGSDRINANTYGLYGTWMSPKGFYVDASYRRVDFKANLRSVGGEQRANGVGDVFNLEAGYTAWTMPGGVDLTPQFQYSWTSIHNIDTLTSDRFSFTSDGGVSWRARLGLAFSKTINAAGIVWTPYGSVNAIQEMDGQSRYLVADQFTGTTSTKGTSGMVELGLGAQKGKLSVTGGVNWTDGGAQQNVFGGQVVLRYTF
ncbi:outer membrane autotransporter barrel domain protein [Rhodanobacter panaciterrae]|uniref:Outer membrane autotransporter barrel domain protein n=1 Tax=Rhodanobacter panaciterrae TaxID=490572 RepID=A0ABQ2ZKX2_9GAMM|nr:outer membrane autotransporter barrel domain protein [Rhodanobacter panaciterrae]